MVYSLSQRALKTPASPIRRLSGLAQAAKREGVHVHHLNIGQPDIASPPEFLTALKNIDTDVVAYESSEGNQELRDAWSASMNAELELNTSPEEFLITVGASEALVFLFMAICDPGDEIVIFDPTYANYIGFAAVTGVELKPVVSRIEEGFRLPPVESIVEQFSEKTRALLLCSPNNPTGTVYSEEELRLLYRLCEERNLFFIVDETYRELVFDDRKPLSILHLEPDSDRVAIVDSLSKRYSLCGARIGCIYSKNEELMAKSLNMAQARLAAPTLEQRAAAELLRIHPRPYLQEARREYEQRRNVLCDRLAQIPGVEVSVPSGAFYTVARLPLENAEEFARFLLRDFRLNGETTFLAPAAGFYMQPGEGVRKTRIAFVLEQECLLRAGEIIEQGLSAFAKLA